MSLDLGQLWDVAWPALTLVLTALATLLTAVLPERHRTRVTAVLTALGFLIAAQGFYYEWELGRDTALDFLVVDRFANYLGALICGIGFISTLVAYPYWLS